MRLCAGLHHWPLGTWVAEQADPGNAGQRLADLIAEPAVLAAIATHWLTSGTQLETALRAVGRADVARRVADARAAADEEWWAETGDEFVIAAIDDTTEERRDQGTRPPRSVDRSAPISDVTRQGDGART